MRWTASSSGPTPVTASMVPRGRCLGTASGQSPSPTYDARVVWIGVVENDVRRITRATGHVVDPLSAEVATLVRVIGVRARSVAHRHPGDSDRVRDVEVDHEVPGVAQLGSLCEHPVHQEDPARGNPRRAVLDPGVGREVVAPRAVRRADAATPRVDKLPADRGVVEAALPHRLAGPTECVPMSPG